MPDPTTNDLAELLEESFDEIQMQLFDIVLYISNMPEEYTGGLYSPSGKGTQDQDHLHSPSPDFFDLLVWNIIVPVWTGVVSSYLYEKFFSGKTTLKSKNELESIKNEVILTSKTKGFQIKLGKSVDISNITKRRSIELLTSYGVPQQDALKQAEEINQKLIAMAQKISEDETQ